MSFLLVLSAVFNALTGAFVGVRPAEPVLHQQASAEIAASVQRAERAAVPAVRPMPPLVAAVAEEPFVAEAPPPPAAAPLDTDRLLE